MTNDGFTLLCLGPVRCVDCAQLLEALIELHDWERRQPSEFGHENLTKDSGTGLLNPCANAFQALQPMYATLPQHQFTGSQFQAKCRIGRRCRRESSPRIWTWNAGKVRFWTENADMFDAPLRW
jgi:hypothetical protein